MSSLIRIKRSGVAGSPSSLAQAELAYSHLTGSVSNGGDRLYIGTGSETNGEAANIDVIGGKYFTDKLDHMPGELVANSALITDEDSAIERLKVDNIQLNNSTISSLAANSNIVLSPNGTGLIDASASIIRNVSDPVEDEDVVNYGFLKSELEDIVGGTAETTFGLIGDIGTHTFEIATQDINFIGGTGVSTVVDGSSITFSIGQDVATNSNVEFANGIFTGDLTVNGDLMVSGDSFVIDAVSLEIEDPLIKLARGNSTDSLDIGFFGNYNSTSRAGLFRSSSDSEWYLFSEYTDDISGNLINKDHTSFALGSLNANTFIGNLQGNANTASELENARTIELTGTVTGVATFDGSSDLNITTNVVNATTTSKGIASFNASNFSVSDGNVTISEVDAGEY